MLGVSAESAGFISLRDPTRFSRSEDMALSHIFCKKS